MGLDVSRWVRKEKLSSVVKHRNTRHNQLLYVRIRCFFKNVQYRFYCSLFVQKGVFYDVWAMVYMCSIIHIVWSFLAQNSFPMREWHLEHIEKIILKFVTGLSVNATRWEKRQHNRYGTLTNVCRQIEYDIKHGVTNEQVLSILQKIRNQSSFSSLLLNNDGSIERLNEIEKHFTPHKERGYWF